MAALGDFHRKEMHEWAGGYNIRTFLFQNQQAAESRPMDMQPLIYVFNWNQHNKHYVFVRLLNLQL